MSVAVAEQELAGGELLYAVRDQIGWVTFNRPQARNAFTFAMYEGLADICGSVPGDGSVKAIVMTGAGDRAFAAGTDIAQFRDFSTPEDAIGYERKMDRVLGTIEDCPVPTIAAIAGACTGGGAGIAACCDIRIAARGAKFGFPIARTLGNCLSIPNYARFVSLIGAARTKEMIFTARLLSDEEAFHTGLVTELLDDHAALMTRANELARQITGNAPLTLRATKEAIKRINKTMMTADGDDLVVMCYTSEDFREGLEAFLAKRPPEWKGR